MGGEMPERHKSAPKRTVAELLPQLEKLMQDEVYLQPNLKVRDLAKLLGTNSRYVQQILNEEIGMSFAEYMNRRRVAHAAKLLNDNPNLDISEVITLSGFSSSSSFYRNFKLYEGHNPKK